MPVPMNQVTQNGLRENALPAPLQASGTDKKVAAGKLRPPPLVAALVFKHAQCGVDPRQHLFPPQDGDRINDRDGHVGAGHSHE